MTRQAFIARLREGLAGLPAHTIAEIVTDYEAHFTEGEAAGRTEAEVAGALGDPDRLARELRAEHGLKRWEEQRNPSSAGAAILAILGLGALDIMFLLPILMGVAGAIFGIGIACIALFFTGGMVFAAGPFTDPPGGPMTAIFFGLAMMGGAASLGALLIIVTTGLVNALVWYGRLHYRVLKPALEPQASGAVQ
jgi:uncharacterized membrane protein